MLQHRLKENFDNSVRNTRSSDIEFLIKWRGFGNKWNTWEPYSNVRLNEVVHEYLRNNKLKRFIPRGLETDPIVNHTVSFSVINYMTENNVSSHYFQKEGMWKKVKVRGKVKEGKRRRVFEEVIIDTNNVV